MDNNQIIPPDDSINDQIDPSETGKKKDLSMPIMLGVGIGGMILMLLMLFSLFQPKSNPNTITPTPLPIKMFISPTKTPTPIIRKISTDSAVNAILDQEASIAAQINTMDFIEQKLVPPVLDLSIAFD